MRAAIYARVSSELQDTQNSLARQLAACRAWATANHAEIADEHIYCDEAVSGVSLLARPALQRLLQQLGRRGSPPWDVVLVDDDSASIAAATLPSSAHASPRAACAW